MHACTVSLVGENRDIVIIDGNASGTVIHVTPSIDNVSISGFTIQNSGYDI